MKNYIKRLIDAFFNSSSVDSRLLDEVHLWLVDNKHSNEKKLALQSLWDELESQPDAHIKQSLFSVYKKVGARNIPHFFTFPKIYYAASFALLILFLSVSVTYYFTKSSYDDKELIENFTASGHKNKILLPDGSIVETNSQTILFYPRSFNGSSRTVYLVGEANFKVKKNPKKPFVVRSNSVSITALGTEFNVMAYPNRDEIIATLIHGKIKVDCNGGNQSHILFPGQQLIYNKSGDTHLSLANLDDITAWQRGILVFRGTNMKDILQIIEQKCDVTFQYPPSLFNNDKFNFSFKEKSSLKEIMNVLMIVVGGFDYELNGRICHLKPLK